MSYRLLARRLSFLWELACLRMSRRGVPGAPPSQASQLPQGRGWCRAAAPCRCNRAPFGGTLQGVAVASGAYLGKSPLQLTRVEAALLAVLPQVPRLAPLLARRLNRVDSPPLIRTTIDATLQRRLEDLLLGWRARLPEHTSAAILVVEEETLAVRAYLGSVDINDARCWPGRPASVISVLDEGGHTERAEFSVVD